MGKTVKLYSCVYLIGMKIIHEAKWCKDEDTLKTVIKESSKGNQITIISIKDTWIKANVDGTGRILQDSLKFNTLLPKFSEQ